MADDSENAPAEGKPFENDWLDDIVQTEKGAAVLERMIAEAEAEYARGEFTEFTELTESTDTF